MNKIYLIKAEESLQSANVLFKNKLYNDAVSRAYYTALQITIVALNHYQCIDINNVREYSHKTIIRAFVKKLIHEKQIYSAEIKGYLQELLNNRITADYEPHITISPEKAKNCVEKAAYFYEIVRNSLQK